MEHRKPEMPDYLNEGFKLPLEMGGVRTYVSINASMAFEEDGLCPTGEYVIYLLHHRLGSCSFIMQLEDENMWVPIHAKEGIEDEIFQKIGDTTRS